ncbi:hypothetical protein GCM10009416_50160 [Craurococcus roseus]|uniref:Glyoxalase/fosfomycin resistance/dioxygenase domain-containing protein n=1 Tax=Craurococcus roseus TaxID=77585 RepID=A0ABN1G9X7_9PROT
MDRPWHRRDGPGSVAAGLNDIRSFDYAILLCGKMEETRAFYRDTMGFPGRPTARTG